MTDAEKLNKLADLLEPYPTIVDDADIALIRQVAQHLSAQPKSDLHWQHAYERERAIVAAQERDIQRYRTAILKYGHAQYTHDRGMWCFWSDRHEDACTPETCIWLEIEALEVPIDSRISRSNQYY